MKKEVQGSKVIFKIGKRKRAIARAWFTPGKGVVRINSVPLENIGNEMVRLRIMEPLIIAGDDWKGYDIHVNVKGGGLTGQAEAVRQAISRGIAEAVPVLRESLLKYDRFMLVYDPRRTEPHKPPRSSQGPRRYKQRSKR